MNPHDPSGRGVYSVDLLAERDAVHEDVRRAQLEAGSVDAGVEISLRIGQRVRHRDCKGRRVTGTVRALAIEDRELMVTIALDEPIVIPASDDIRQIDIYTQHVPAHELAPFDDRDELIAELVAALSRCRFDSLNMSFADLAFCRAAIAKATGATA